MKGLLAPLRRLDRLIEKAVDLAQAAYGPQAAADPYRGLYINRDEVRRLLVREPGAPLLWSGDECIEGSEPQTSMKGSRINWLKEAFGLSHFDLTLSSLLSHLSWTRYERLYAYLQDNVTRRKASVDLALNLLCSTAEEKLKDEPIFLRRMLPCQKRPDSPDCGTQIFIRPYCHTTSSWTNKS